ncbi:MAG: quinone-dependent dihydroorotate dehydrogenase [Ferruginibacter sp.]
MQPISKLSFIQQNKKLNTSNFAAMYKMLRSLLFFFDAEQVHYFSMNALKRICHISFVRKWISNQFRVKDDHSFSVWSMKFPNRVGLGAGFDKNALYLDELSLLGFGFVEIGTVTPRPQKGNDKPRLFRLKKDKALINRMGFNNDGADVITGRLKQWREVNGQLTKYNNYNIKIRQLTTFNFQLSTLIIGANLGKNKDTPNEDAWKDYGYCFEKLYDYADYFVVNVSSPNTAGLRELQDKEALRKILVHLQSLNNIQHRTTNQIKKPILLKIAPDLSLPQLDDVISLATEIHLDGLIVANTTISREHLSITKERLDEIGAGGLSGKPLMKKSTEMLAYIAEKTNRNIPIIASGGIFTAADAVEKFKNGASLIQVWTGFIYEGPAIVKNICKGI